MLDPAAAEVHAHAAAILLDALEIPAEMVARRVDGGAQQALQAVPRGQDLPQRLLGDDAAVAVERDPLLDLDAELARAGAARGQRMQQLRMGGDAGAAADQLDAGALVDVAVPADPAQERGGEQARHRTADDDGPALGWSRHCAKN